MQKNEGILSRLPEKKTRERLAEVYGKEAVASALKRYEALSRAMLAARPNEEQRFFSSPGRTELGGNHTDHNRGRVLCAAIDLDAVACVVPNRDRSVRIHSEGYDPIEIDLSDLECRSEERGTTAALVRGIARGLADRGAPVKGFDALIHSTVLPGSGLSSSAAVENLFGGILSDLAQIDTPAIELAKLGKYAENDYFGKPCGLMDQAASAVGGVVTIDFADPAKPRVKRIKYDFRAEGYALVVVNTGGSHADLTADYAAIPSEMQVVASFFGAESLREVEPELLLARGPEIRKAAGDRALLRALHFVGENRRVLDMVAALSKGSLRKYFKLVKKSGDSSWKLLQNLYPPEAPEEQGLCLALALSADFLGKKGAARVHGGGFAGTIQAYVPLDMLDGYSALMERYFGSGAMIKLAVRPLGAVKIF